MFVGNAPNINRLWADLIVEELVRCGVDMFCIASGSRSTPLTTAVAAHPKARKVIHFDERGTAFYGLGYARASRRPAVWITTSGTAVANGFPAVVEASMDGVPMLLLTADRPPELRHTGANQTIDQVGIFGDYIRWQFDLPVPSVAVDPAMVLTTIDQAVYRSQRVPNGPVHLNLMFREPLAPDPDGTDIGSYLTELEPWRRGDESFTSYGDSKPSVDADELDRLWKDLQDVKRGLIVAGRLDTPAQGKAVFNLSKQLDWPLLPDVGSQLRLGKRGISHHRVDYYDLILGSDSFSRSYRPEAVLHIGKRSTSKRLMEYLKQSRPSPYIVVNDLPGRLDPGHRVSRHIETDIIVFCRRLQEACERNPVVDPDTVDWLTTWNMVSTNVAHQLSDFFYLHDGISEPQIARLVSKHIPDGQGLFLAGSMPIRDMDMFGQVGNAAITVGSNRGASGIDGTLASAAGFAAGLKKPVTLLIGDLALLHDLNSLALLRKALVPVIIVVINNNGGGIFSFLPVAKYQSVFETYFGTPHGLTFEQGAAMFEIPYDRAYTTEHFVEMYQNACSTGSATIIEVSTDRSVNYELHMTVQKQINDILKKMS